MDTEPSQPAPNPQDLLDDAKHVAAHGARAGALKDDHPLFGAISDAEAERLQGAGLGWDSAAVMALHRALGSAMLAIRPVTLHDLKGGWRLDGKPKGGFGSTSLKAAVLVFTVAVMALCASLTMWQQRASQLVEEMAKNKAEQQLRALEEFVLLVGSLRNEPDALERIRDPSSAVRTALRSKYAALLALETEMIRDREALNGLKDHALDYVWTSAARAVGTGAAVLAGLGDTVVAPGSAAVEEAAATPSAPAAAPAAGEATACGEPPAVDVAGLFREGLTDVQYFRDIVDHDRAYVDWIRCKTDLKLSYAFLAAPGPEVMHPPGLQELKAQLDSIGTWWLPTLYGMLGALIYHLRAYLSSLRPDPSFMPVVMRVCLGGFAGAAVAWFWQPDSGDFLGVPVKMGTLTLAFLVGFAIDVFLSFLDRLVTLMHRWVGSLGDAARP